MAEARAEMVDQLLELFEAGGVTEGLELIADLHPADVADLLEHLPREGLVAYFQALPPEVGSEVFLELEEAQRATLIKSLTNRQLAGLLINMDSDDAADLVSDLPEDQVPSVLTRIEKDDQQEVRKLLTYPEDTAGGLMQMEMVTVPQDITISQAMGQVREQAEEIDDFNNIFVTSGDRRLMGVLSLRDMLVAQPSAPVGEIMDDSPATLRPDDDQEEVGQLFQKYDLLSAPVVDTRGRLVGRVTIDDVVDVIQEEASEDIYRSVGTDDEELAYGEAALKIYRLRLPWVMTNLIGSLTAAYLLSLFEVTLGELIALVSFIPAVTAMGGNVGIQTSTVFVRSIALGSPASLKVGRVFLREIKVALIMGLTCSLLTASAATIWDGRPILGVLIGVAMFTDICLASTVGVLAPALFKRIGVDPAIASGPLVTTANDIMGILVYMGLATLFIKYLLV